MKKNDKTATNGKGRKLRSLEWFNNPHNPGMTALYLERYLNYGLTREELQSGKPIIGIAQTGNDLSPCNRHHLELAHRVREGIRAAGGIAMEFPTHPIQETGKRPTAALDRNLAYLGLVEILYGYPLDGVVLTTGCDKTTPACMMAAATVNLPAIVLSGGPMLNGWHNGERTASGTIVWKSRARLAAGGRGTAGWRKSGAAVPLLVNTRPAGVYLGEEFHRAGGVPAVVRELMKHKRIHEDAVTVNGRGIGENCANAPKPDSDVIWAYDKPLVKDAGFLVLKGNLFDSAIMKTSVISKEFRDRYLSNPKDPSAFEGRAIVFEGPEDYHARLDDESLNIDEHCMLFVRGVGPIGYPGGAEVVNMQPPAALIKRGITALPCIGDGRQSGTSGSPSILNASPEAAADGGLAILRTGDKVRIDLNKGDANILITSDELKKRHAELKAKGGFAYPANQTPWQELYRSTVGQQATGACMELATRYHNIAGTIGVARDNH